MYEVALQNLGITQNNTEEIAELDTTPCPPDSFCWNWGKYPGNTRIDLKPEITIELQKLYMRGREGGLKLAYDILNETVLQYYW